MKLIQYARPQNRLAHKSFSDIMDEFFNESLKTDKDSFWPDINISETDEQFTITADLPGVNKEAIHINLEDGRLVISGE